MRSQKGLLLALGVLDNIGKRESEKIEREGEGEREAEKERERDTQMDHSMMDHDMDHGGMDHGGHGGMDHGGGGGGMHMGDQCSMNMLFTWDTKNLCIVFRQWRITGTFSLIVSLLAIVALCAGYELLRNLARRYEVSADSGKGDLPPNESSSLISGRAAPAQSRDAKQVHMVKAGFYAVQVFYSFMIMLLFMTYNGWIMLAVAVGSFIGFLMFGGGNTATKSAACH